MGAVFKREMGAYFSSAIGYVFLGIYLALSGFYFVMSTFYSGSLDLASLFSIIQIFLLVLIPLLTMKMWSEEKKMKTDQALLTAPQSLLKITMGKYLAAFTVFAIAVSSSILYTIVLAFFGKLELLVIIGNIFGLLLLGGAMIAIGMFVSNLTENQVVAAVGTIGILIILQLVGSIPLDSIGVTFIKNALTWFFAGISIYSRFQGFSQGLFNYADAIYYLSVIAIFVFLTVRFLEIRRWK
jgi:ABC-2 type transport system permease protein